ncbi:MAG: ubiquinone/menaquinone biosynthesis C-methylase UbiE [Pseudohongiellaceae bacterium]|jgi:ubiquinone/menaquinone biosynthesis C-methylase UbiE
MLLLTVAGCAQPQKPLPDSAGEPVGRNERFLSEELDVDQFTKVFESETREVSLARDEIVAALGLRPGEVVADVGSGTGLFLGALCEAVGKSGKVVAVEISPRFGEHLERRIADEGLSQAELVMCDERSSNLEPDSVDLVFVCDTYHHFDYPADTLASLRGALREEGRLVVIDFDRKPGVSSDWVMDHLRAGKDVFLDEITAAGFELSREVSLPQFRLSYMLIFDRVR